MNKYTCKICGELFETSSLSDHFAQNYVCRKCCTGSMTCIHNHKETDSKYTCDCKNSKLNIEYNGFYSEYCNEFCRTCNKYEPFISIIGSKCPYNTYDGLEDLWHCKFNKNALSSIHCSNYVDCKDYINAKIQSNNKYCPYDEFDKTDDQWHCKFNKIICGPNQCELDNFCEIYKKQKALEEQPKNEHCPYDKYNVSDKRWHCNNNLVGLKFPCVFNPECKKYKENKAKEAQSKKEYGHKCSHNYNIEDKYYCDYEEEYLNWSYSPCTIICKKSKMNQEKNKSKENVCKYEFCSKISDSGAVMYHCKKILGNDIRDPNKPCTKSRRCFEPKGIFKIDQISSKQNPIATNIFFDNIEKEQIKYCMWEDSSDEITYGCIHECSNLVPDLFCHKNGLYRCNSDKTCFNCPKELKDCSFVPKTTDDVFRNIIQKDKPFFTQDQLDQYTSQILPTLIKEESNMNEKKITCANCGYSATYTIVPNYCGQCGNILKEREPFKLEKPNFIKITKEEKDIENAIRDFPCYSKIYQKTCNSCINCKSSYKDYYDKTHFGCKKFNMYSLDGIDRDEKRCILWTNSKLVICSICGCLIKKQRKCPVCKTKL